MTFTPFPRIAAMLFFALTVGFGAATATAQSFQSDMACEMDYRECERSAADQNPGKDPCSAYSRCQAKQMCTQSRCVCKRTHGSDDPALASEAMAMCSAVLTPNGPNSCDRYIKACQDWSAAQHAEPQAPAQPQHPADPTTPGGGGQLIPPDQQPRFR